MLFQNAEGREKDRAPAARFSPLEVEAIEMFINFLRIIGLQKSVGEIYGLLFVSAKAALAMDEIVNRLDISLGAASQGLKLLRSVGAVKLSTFPGVRRDHFAADLELSKFAAVFIKEELRPRVERALERDTNTWNPSLRRCPLRSATRRGSAWFASGTGLRKAKRCCRGRSNSS